MLPILMRGEATGAARAMARAALDGVGLHDKYSNLPAELSGGEQQRVSIARAVAGKPKILFADEPTANLDSVSGTQVIGLITKLNREDGQTVVMVTHDAALAERTQRTIRLFDGRQVQ